MSSYVQVDTDILIDVSRGVQDAIDCLKHHSAFSTLAISAVTQMELIVGCQNKQDLSTLEQVLKRFLVLPLTPAISTQAVQLLQQHRLSHGLLIADALIAATAIESNYAFISKNQRDFRFITELTLLPYPI